MQGVGRNSLDVRPLCDVLTFVEQQKQQRLIDTAIAIGLAGAFIGVVFAMTSMWRYESAAGPADATPPVWPAASSLPRIEGTSTVVLFAHPRCPCTRASISELAKIMAHEGKDVRVFVAFRGTDDPKFVQTDSWDSAKAIPGVQVLEDRDGVEMRRFGALTSGHVVVYDADDNLRFSGGITGARGHVGDNAGASTVAKLIMGARGEQHDTPVFGCALHDSEPVAAQVR